MPDAFDQVHAEAKPVSGGDAFDQIHAQATAPEPKSVGGFAGNVLSSAANLVGSGVSAIVHPLDTLSTIGSIPVGAAEKLYQAAGGKLSAEQQADPKDAAKKLDAIIDHFKGRYGSLDAAKEALYKDPVGVAADVSMLFGGAGSVADAAGLGRVAKVARTVSEVTNPVNVAVKGASAITKGAVNAATGGDSAAALRASAEKNFNTALNPTTKINKALVQNKVAPGLVDRGVTATSLEDLRAQAQAQMETHSAAIDDAFDAAKDQNIRLDWEPIVRKLEAAKASAIVDGVIPVSSKAYISKLDALQDEVLKVADANGGTIPADSMRKLRQMNDKVVAQSKGGFAMAPDDLSAIDAHKVSADALRSSIAEALPDAAKANKEYSFWADVDKVAGDTGTRRVGQKSPLTEHMAQAGGAAIGGTLGGPKGAAAGAYLGGRLARLQNSMVWNSVSAQTKSRVAGLIKSGDTAGALEVADRAALLASQAGRLEQAAVPAK